MYAIETPPQMEDINMDDKNKMIIGTWFQSNDTDTLKRWWSPGEGISATWDPKCPSVVTVYHVVKDEDGDNSEFIFMDELPIATFFEKYIR